VRHPISPSLVGRRSPRMRRFTGCVFVPQPAPSGSQKAIPSSATPHFAGLDAIVREASSRWRNGSICRMYADGDGVTQDDLRAFEYFSRIAMRKRRTARQRRTAIVNAFVALGRYYLNGIHNSKIKFRSGPGEGYVLFACVLFRQCRRAIHLARLYLLKGVRLVADISAMARAGWCLAATERAQHQRRPGSARSVQRRPAVAAAARG